MEKNITLPVCNSPQIETQSVCRDAKCELEVKQNEENGDIVENSAGPRTENLNSDTGCANFAEECGSVAPSVSKSKDHAALAVSQSSGRDSVCPQVNSCSKVKETGKAGYSVNIKAQDSDQIIEDSTLADAVSQSTDDNLDLTVENEVEDTEDCQQKIGDNPEEQQRRTVYVTRGEAVSTKELEGGSGTERPMKSEEIMTLSDTISTHDANDDGKDDRDQSGVNDGENTEEQMEMDNAGPRPATDACPRDTGFTSEKFKIEINELPRKFGFAQLKKRLSVTLGLRPHKLKGLPMKSFAYVCFSSEEDREQALQAINGHVWKGRCLRAKKAQPSADPMKRKHDDSEDSTQSTKRPRLDNSVPPSIRLKNCVEPLWEVSYEEQLQRKTGKAKEALRAVAYHGEVRFQFMKARKENDGMCCPLQPIMPSPVKEGYRNKSEFSIGRSEDRSETVVGFRFGLYKDGTDCVGSPSEISIITPESKKIVESFEKYVRQSQYPPFDHRTHSGHWRQLTVRTTRAGGGNMAIAEFVVNNISQEQMQAEKDSIHRYFTEGEGKAANVSTFFFRPCSPKTSNSTSEEPYELIYGDGHIFETMLDMKFRISPSAFFQVNTAAAEGLYKLIADWSNVSPTTAVLDICCGTGTIGQSMAKNVAKVIGIEMCKEAVEDAQVNAALNGITNVQYHCAKVEQVISDITRRVSNDCVAILDPPRGGVHQSVIKSLRTCHRLNRIVYAACNPAGAKQNFIDLCRPKSRKTRGEPFKFVRAMPIDMFPSTTHFELLVLFERDPSETESSSSEAE